MLFFKNLSLLAFSKEPKLNLLDKLISQWNEKFHSRCFTHLSEAFQNMQIPILKYMLEPEAMIEILSEHRKGDIYLIIGTFLLNRGNLDLESLSKLQNNDLLILFAVKLKNFELLEKVVVKNFLNEREFNIILEGRIETIKWFLDYKNCLKDMSIRYFVNTGINISKLPLDSFILVFNHFSWDPELLLCEYMSELVKHQNLQVLNFLIGKLKERNKDIVISKEITFYICKEVRNGNFEMANVLLKLKKLCKTD